MQTRDRVERHWERIEAAFVADAPATSVKAVAISGIFYTVTESRLQRDDIATVLMQMRDSIFTASLQKVAMGAGP